MRPTLILACIAVLGLAGGGWAADPTAESLAALKEKMPKEQRAVVEKLERIREMQASMEKEKNGLKRQELKETIDSTFRDVLIQTDKISHDKGYDGWVFRCKSLDGDSAMFEAGLLRYGIGFARMPEDIRKVVRTLSVGDVVKVSCQPNRNAIVHDVTVDFTPPVPVWLHPQTGIVGLTLERITTPRK